MTDDGRVDSLAAAVDVLCAEHRVRVDRDDAAVAELLATLRAVAGALDKNVPAQRRQILRLADRAGALGRGHAVQPSLLTSLRDAADPMGGVENDRPGGSVRIPINADAIDLLDRIRGTVRDALDLHGLDARAPAEGVDPIWSDLRRLTVAHWASLDGGPEARDRLAQRIGRYAANIRELLDPDPQERSMRDAPCQSCGAVTIREHRDGEDWIVPALRVDLSGGHLRGVECRACLAYIWRETDASGEHPAGALAALRDWVREHREQAGYHAAVRRHHERVEAEARYPSRETA